MNFEKELASPSLRSKVRALVPAFHLLRDLGSSLIPREEASSARDRILFYLKKYPKIVVEGDELMVVSGINDWPRRIRELRVQFGWWIYSGVTFSHMVADAEAAGNLTEVSSLKILLGVDPAGIKPEQYVLMRSDQDREAAHRWNILNEIRRKSTSVMAKILEYLRKNVGAEISGEELKYLAKDKKEWARRVRELRTEYGWPIATKNSGREDLAVGVYLLEEDRQAYEHDRAIPDPVRVAVLERDGHRCTHVGCGWHRGIATRDDPRKMLELHHIEHHSDGGDNSIDNLTTLCNVHHDEVHRRSRR
ncbi:MAG: HNH endonuclease signature motif containing protein [Nitrospiraceae bacterium]